MPLLQGKSPASFSHNVSTEVKAGRPQAQALAIAYALKRKAMSNGGEMDVGPNTPHEELAHAIMQHLCGGGMVDGYSKGGEVTSDQGYLEDFDDNSPFDDDDDEEDFATGGMVSKLMSHIKSMHRK